MLMRVLIVVQVRGWVGGVHEERGESECSFGDCHARWLPVFFCMCVCVMCVFLCVFVSVFV